MHYFPINSWILMCESNYTFTDYSSWFKMNNFANKKEKFLWVFFCCCCFCFKMWLSFSHILPQPQRLLVRVCDYVVKWKCMRCSIFILCFCFLLLFVLLYILSLLTVWCCRSKSKTKLSLSIFSYSLSLSTPTIPFMLKENVNRLSY